jgi:hypothetical protein
VKLAGSSRKACIKEKALANSHSDAPMPSHYATGCRRKSPDPLMRLRGCLRNQMASTPIRPGERLGNRIRISISLPRAVRKPISRSTEYQLMVLERRYLRLVNRECRSGLGLAQLARRQNAVNCHSEAHFGIELSGVRQAKIGTLQELTSIASPLLIPLRISHLIPGPKPEDPWRRRSRRSVN